MSRRDLPAFKMNGTGNAILVLDARGEAVALAPDEVRAIARQDDLGFDQLMLIGEPRRAGTAAFVRIFNNDGTEAGACGNGTRCVARVLLHDSAQGGLTVETPAGTLACERLSATRFSVDMGQPRFAWAEIPLAEAVADTRRFALAPVAGLPRDLPACAAVSMGNPHAVFFVQDVEAVDLDMLGPLIEHHPLFPERANVSFAQVVDSQMIRLRVWERSAGATLACGSAACATAVASARAGLTGRDTHVHLPGGELVITWREADGHVVMAGETELEWAGTLPAALWSSAA